MYICHLFISFCCFMPPLVTSLAGPTRQANHQPPTFNQSSKQHTLVRAYLCGNVALVGVQCSDFLSFYVVFLLFISSYINSYCFILYPTDSYARVFWFVGPYLALENNQNLLKRALFRYGTRKVTCFKLRVY